MAVFGTSVLDRAVYRQESGDMIVSWYRGNDTIYCDAVGMTIQYIGFFFFKHTKQFHLNIGTEGSTFEITRDERKDKR